MVHGDVPCLLPLTCLVLQGTLATLDRQRGNLLECRAVLDMELAVLQRYTRSSEGADAQQVCLPCYALPCHEDYASNTPLPHHRHLSLRNSLGMYGAAKVCSTSTVIFATTFAARWIALHFSVLLYLLSDFT
jgi:hypothetical protein